MELKTTKICKDCGRELPIEMFGKNKGMRDGHINSCKDCVRKRDRKRKETIFVPAITEGTMVCPVCGKELPVDEFKIWGKSKTGRDWLCKNCREYHSKLNNGQDKNYFRKLRIKVSPEYRKEQSAIDRKSRIKNFKRAMYTAAKYRAEQKGIEFNIEMDDIIIPDKCPILECDFVYGTEHNYEYSPSLDRIDNSKGYVKGNVMVISSKANKMKNSATLHELQMFCKNILRYSPNYVEKEDIELKDKEPLG